MSNYIFNFFRLGLPQRDVERIRRREETKEGSEETKMQRIGLRDRTNERDMEETDMRRIELIDSDYDLERQVA